MALTPGTRIGVYEVTALIGEGGMGQVYRATDTTLGRQVAIKILPDAFASDPERLARFEREAKTLASLNHPHIAAIYAVEKSAGLHALVMELVEGEDLSQRIARGPIPVDEALPIAKQIAEALEAAHEQGIIHRDLKPANINVRPDGTVKVLDFGLAKALEPVASSNVNANVTQSPTITSPAMMTGVGAILGTAAYMSPEQARGRPVDKRADIWAFGCVLYEMLTGRLAFDEGETVSDAVAAVLTRDPDWNALPAAVPPTIDRILRRCLQKDVQRRQRDIGDVRIELDDPEEAPTVAIRHARSRWWRALPWITASLAVVTAFAVGARRAPGEASRDVLHLDLASPPNVEVQGWATQSFALSPDGRQLAFVGGRDGVRHLFLRNVTLPAIREIPGALGGTAAAFSPDGTHVAFVNPNAALTTLSLGDSAVKLLATGADLASAGLAWGDAGIVYLRENTLWFVSPSTGNPRRLTTLDASRGETIHAGPVWLPGGRVVLFASLTNQPGGERLEAVSVDGEPRRSIVMDHAKAAAWSITGQLLFDRDGALMAVPFDRTTLTATGTASIVMPAGMMATNSYGGLALQVTSDGALVYVPAASGNRSIVRVNHDGSSSPLDVAPARYTNPRLSPDGHRLALDESQTSEVLINLARGATKIPLLQPAIGSGFVTWNSDGSRLAFRRFNQLFSMAADGRGDGAPIPYSEALDYPSSAGPDPDSILVVRISPETSGDIYLLSMTGAFKPRPPLTGRGYQGGPQLSPDHRWLLYQSDESDHAEIYVRSYPALDRAFQVSVGGGLQPRWSQRGREITYRAGVPMMSVTFDGTAATPILGKPLTLFEQTFDYGQSISLPNYDVGADGRFVMLRPEQSVAPFHVVLNWDQELKRLVPTK